ncbi:hypothetical protein BJ165DRAFT_772365 [Panaeolus papilionaceus]|nr:hypothetical protein BJ165DRAFT_772365 [Panaeolus papilionaceus]
MNTRKSALEILNDIAYHGVDAFGKPAFAASSNLYQDLHERIECALQAKQMIEFELAQPEVQTNVGLRAVLKNNQRENQEMLTKFITQFANFNPLPAEFRLAAQHLRKSIAANTRPSNIKYRMLFWQWAHEPEISDGTDTSLVPSQKLSFKGLLHPFLQVPKRQAAGLSNHGE